MFLNNNKKNYNKNPQKIVFKKKKRKIFWQNKTSLRKIKKYKEIVNKRFKFVYYI